MVFFLLLEILARTRLIEFGDLRAEAGVFLRVMKSRSKTRNCRITRAGQDKPRLPNSPNRVRRSASRGWSVFAGDEITKQNSELPYNASRSRQASSPAPLIKGLKWSFFLLLEILARTRLIEFGDL